jgi:hypothetical protein
MASSKIVKYTSGELEEKRRRGESKTDWERVRKMKDEEIDYTDSPERRGDARAEEADHHTH